MEERMKKKENSETKKKNFFDFTPHTKNNLLPLFQEKTNGNGAKHPT